MNNSINKKSLIIFAILPILAIALHFIMSNLLYWGMEKIFLNIFHIAKNEIIKFATLGEAIIHIVLILIFLYFYNLTFKNDNYESKEKVNSKNALSTGIIAGIGVSGFSFIVINVAQKIPVLKDTVQNMNQIDGTISISNIVNIILISVIAAPIIEEIVFRRIIFRSIRKISNIWLSIIISSILFGIYHMNPIAAIYASFMGIVASIIYEKYRNLIFPIIAHITNNFIASLHDTISINIINEIINIISLIMLIPLGYILYNCMKNKREYNL